MSKYQYVTPIEFRIRMSDQVCVCGGFSPDASSETESAKQINVVDMLTSNPNASYMMVAEGHSMEPLIQQGDVLVVDPHLSPADQDVVILSVGSHLIVKRHVLIADSGGVRVTFMPDNPSYRPIDVSMVHSVVGVVSSIVRRLK